MDFRPDAIFLSNGPGDPQPLKSAIELAKKAIDNDFLLLEFVLVIKSLLYLKVFQLTKCIMVTVESIIRL